MSHRARTPKTKEPHNWGHAVYSVLTPLRCINIYTINRLKGHLVLKIRAHIEVPSRSGRAPSLHFALMAASSPGAAQLRGSHQLGAHVSYRHSYEW